MKSAAALFATLALAGPVFSQQQSPPAPSTPSPDAQHGKVIYQRSDNDAAAKPRTSRSGSDPTVKSEITDADRTAVTFTRYALDLRLRPVEHALAVRAKMTVHNDGDHPLSQVPLQLSSTLDWEEILIAGAHARFLQSSLDSDTDHTGSLHEAAVVLPKPLAPGASLDLDVIYSGEIPQSSQRLQSIGTPADAAARSDWDEIAPDFIGIRGFGNVVWYPVSSVPVRLGDGDKLFAEIGRIKLREQTAAVSIHVTEEAFSPLPDVAFLNGAPVILSVGLSIGHPNVPSIATCSLPETPLGFQTLSVFFAERHLKGIPPNPENTGRPGRIPFNKIAPKEMIVFSLPGKIEAAEAYLTAAGTIMPLMRTWLGGPPRLPFSVFELPEVDDAPFEQGRTLYTGLQPAAAPELTGPLSHSLTHAYFVSPRPWLNEGVAQFMSTLWTEQSQSREAALTQLNAQRGALALAEPVAGSSLLHTSDAIFYRTKAAFVLWMLRSAIGDDALQATLHAYDPAADTQDDYFEKLVGKYNTKSSKGPSADDLHWLFDDWIYHDRGLPDLSITGVYPSKASAPNSYLVAVNVANSGSAAAVVPVTVASGTTQVTERMLIPANGTAVRRILIQDEPIRVELNDGTVPEVEASEHVQRIHYTQPSTP